MGEAVIDQGPAARLAGLDGLRALAVVAVIGYHLGLEALPGGYLGVEVFFVISGFLITTLLMAEWRGTGTIRLGAFWIRRGRRLVPALVAVTFAVLATAAVAFPDQLARLGTDAAAGLLYVSNWQQLLTDQSYFEQIGRPSALLHLWSLGIEGQFYLIWPVALVIALLVGGPRLGLLLAVLGLAGSIAVTVMAAPGSDPSRVYYGADTRAAGLLAGAILAFTGIGVRESVARRRFAAQLGWELIGWLALAGVIAAFVLIPPDAPGFFGGGLLVIDAITVALIAAVVAHGGGILSQLLELPPIRWVGTRSYGLYLWHWPVFVFTQPGLDLPMEEPVATIVRLALVVALTEVSYRFVETPLRRARPKRDSLPGLTRRRGILSPGPALRAAGGLAAAAVLVPLLVAVATAQPTAPPSELVVGGIDGLVTGGEEEPPMGSAGPAASGAPSGGPSPGSTLPPVPGSPGDPPTFALGESVLVGAARPIARAIGPMEVNARIGRQVTDAIDVLERRAEAGLLGRVVLLHIGNNGPMRREEADEVMQILHDVPVVIWINLRVPRQWERHNNDLIDALPERYSNVRVVDWHGASAGRRSLLAADGVHLTPDGYRVLATLVHDTLAETETETETATAP